MSNYTEKDGADVYWHPEKPKAAAEMLATIATVERRHHTEARAKIHDKAFTIRHGTTYSFEVCETDLNAPLFWHQIFTADNSEQFLDQLCKLGEFLAETIPLIYEYREGRMTEKPVLEGFLSYDRLMRQKQIFDEQRKKQQQEHALATARKVVNEERSA